MDRFLEIYLGGCNGYLDKAVAEEIYEKLEPGILETVCRAIQDAYDEGYEIGYDEGVDDGYAECEEGEGEEEW